MRNGSKMWTPTPKISIKRWRAHRLKVAMGKYRKTRRRICPVRCYRNHRRLELMKMLRPEVIRSRPGQPK